MPNTSGTGICDEDRTPSHGRRDSIIIGRITPTLSNWFDVILDNRPNPIMFQTLLGP